VNFQHRTFPRFWRRYAELPEEVQRQADKQYHLLRKDPTHPSLRLKAVGPFWAVRISSSYRALAIRKGDVFHWFWIGTHDEYERILKG
jgi:hypothetical protein